MATKKTTATAETTAEETAAETTAEETAADAGTSAAVETEAAQEAEKVTMVYIGPSIPRSSLRNAQIITGTEAEIGTYLESLIESYPEIPHLLVKPSELAEAQKKVQTAGNILHKYYEDMAAKARARKGRN